MKDLPEYLEAHEIESIIRATDYLRARLFMLEQWSAGLRTARPWHLGSPAFATCHLLKNGIQINYLSRWLGHSFTQTTADSESHCVGGVERLFR